MNISIVPMEQSHIKGLAEIEKQCFSKPWTESGFEGELANDTAHFLVAEHNGTEIGYIGFHTVLDEAYIANIAVLPEYRKNGVAGSLLGSAVDYCRVGGFAFISLEVRRSNTAAISLYKKFGFEFVGERKNFYTEPIENAYIMTLNFGGQEQ